MKTVDILGMAGLAGVFGGSVWAVLPAAAFMDPAERERIEQSVTYGGCNEVRALGNAPLYAGQPGYRIEMDGDGDGVACEAHF